MQVLYVMICLFNLNFKWNEYIIFININHFFFFYTVSKFITSRLRGGITAYTGAWP